MNYLYASYISILMLKPEIVAIFHHQFELYYPEDVYSGCK